MGKLLCNRGSFFCFKTIIFTSNNSTMLNTKKYKTVNDEPKSLSDQAKKDGGKILVEKKNGTIAEWGNDIKETATKITDTQPNDTFRTAQSTNATKSGYQGSPENTKAIQDKEVRLRKQSSYANGGGRRQ